MPAAIGSLPVIPLTSEVFGPHGDRVIHGQLDDCTIGLDRYVGFCLVAEGGGETFSHPTLFDQAARPLYRGLGATGRWVQVTLLGGLLHMQPWDRFTYELIGIDIVQAEPVRVSQVGIDVVVDFLNAVAREERCPNPECQGARDRTLDRHRSVWFRDSGTGPRIVCSRCFRQAVEKRPELAERVIFDGRRLPPGAPVMILAP